MKAKDIITESQHKCPHCGGPLVEYSGLMEKKDACYYKVKASAKVWPSAYASGRLVQCRKKGAGNYGNKSESVSEGLEQPKEAFQAIKNLQRFAQDNSDFTLQQLDNLPSRGNPIKPMFANANLAIDTLIQVYKIRKELGNAEFLKQLKDEINYFLTDRTASSDPTTLGDLLMNKLGKINFQQGVAEAQLDEKCWDGYQQQGMKNKSGRQVPNCVPVTEDIDPEIEEMYEAMEQLAEEMAATKGVSVDLVWESFEALDDHMLYETAAWRRKEGKSAKGGLNAKGVASYRRENPGSKLQTAVTTKPSKLKPGSKAAKRRKSFCARMGGVKGPMKKPNGKPTRKALALRKWNC